MEMTINIYLIVIFYDSIYALNFMLKNNNLLQNDKIYHMI